MNKKQYVIIAKYNSKYGKILYAKEVKNDDTDVDLDNVYLNTLYYKGENEIKVGECYTFMVVKAENGYTYALD